MKGDAFRLRSEVDRLNDKYFKGKNNRLDVHAFNGRYDVGLVDGRGTIVHDVTRYGHVSARDALFELYRLDSLGDLRSWSNESFKK